MNKNVLYRLFRVDLESKVVLGLLEIPLVNPGDQFVFDFLVFVLANLQNIILDPPLIIDNAFQ